jgi:DNA-binding NtrC family response regulator
MTKHSILVVDDDAPFRGVLATELERLGFSVDAAASGADALAFCATHEPDVVLLDLRMPDMDGLSVLRVLRQRETVAEVILLTGHGSMDTAIEAIREGAFDYVAKPCPLDELEMRIQRALERRTLRRQTRLLERGLTPPDVAAAFIGDSPAFQRLLSTIGRVGPSRSTVLITGETGAGKEMAAKLLHARSPRADRPFVTVECAALQESLLQSELFGHERGAFTGADRAKAGLFEVAHGGTVFLDEIGEISQSTQVKLLRVLDTSTFRHVGGTKEIQVDVRVVAATNRDLEAMVRRGLFREDLYFRLSTISVRVPPLRERPQDIRLLARHFVSLLNDRFGVQRHISDRALDRLSAHDWPGNVRELLHVIEAATIACDGPAIEPEHLPALMGGSTTPRPPSTDGDHALVPLADVEREHILRVVRATTGHRSHAAQILGISERNLYRKLREYAEGRSVG